MSMELCVQNGQRHAEKVLFHCKVGFGKSGDDKRRVRQPKGMCDERRQRQGRFKKTKEGKGQETKRERGGEKTVKKGRGKRRKKLRMQKYKDGRSNEGKSKEGKDSEYYGEGKG